MGALDGQTGSNTKVREPVLRVEQCVFLISFRARAVNEVGVVHAC